MATGSAPRLRICFFNRSYHPDQGATGQLLTDLARGPRARRPSRGLGGGRPPAAQVGAARAGGRAAPARCGASRSGARNETACGSCAPGAPTLGPGRFAGRAANYLSFFGSSCLAGLAVPRPDVVVALTDPPIIGLAAARVRPAHRRALRLPVPGRLPGGGAPARGLPERAGRSAARARHAPAHRPRGPRRRDRRDDARAARGRQGRRSRPRHGHPQLGGLRGHRPRAEAQSVSLAARPGRAVRRHALRQHRPVPGSRRPGRRRRAAAPPIPTSWSSSSATA